jgi:hypothetical protein
MKAGDAAFLRIYILWRFIGTECTSEGYSPRMSKNTESPVFQGILVNKRVYNITPYCKSKSDTCMKTPSVACMRSEQLLAFSMAIDA